MNLAEPTCATSNASRFSPDPTAHIKHDRFLNHGAKFEHSFTTFDNRRQLIRKFEELDKGSHICALVDLCESTMKVDHITSVRCRHGKNLFRCTSNTDVRRDARLAIHPSPWPHFSRAEGCLVVSIREVRSASREDSCCLTSGLAAGCVRGRYLIENAFWRLKHPKCRRSPVAFRVPFHHPRPVADHEPAGGLLDDHHIIGFSDQ